MTGAPMTGHCLCGAVTVRVAGLHDPRPGACHCRMCQRWSGGLFLCFSADAAGVTVDGPVTRYASSDFAERAFCPVCGSHLWMRDNTGASYDLMPGLFDEARDQPLRSEVYVDRAMASVRLQGDHRRATQAEYEQKNHHVAGVAP
ncbi:MAG: GFA family protein [Rhodobacter sp.]|nr:GFA family protein [Rhodobacter sp.]MCA3459276.1 GFA family protein [Rhodobacter sp.]MCA3462702.1 GFA family protein [Rhodobacter sp.]MCA3465682.1 GFA family protein [Rhodobacter sp.]MCA3467919.1 GFA family protein [Rhodobacter sp.]